MVNLDKNNEVHNIIFNITNEYAKQHSKYTLFKHGDTKFYYLNNPFMVVSSTVRRNFGSQLYHACLYMVAKSI